MNQKPFFMILAIILIAAVFGFWLGKKKAIAPAPQITNFEECARAGYPVTENYPRQCRTQDGKTFVENIGGGTRSGVTGEVTLSPACPAERVPPEPMCDPQPYETEITITKSGFSKRIKSDSAGRFSVNLGPGFYEFQAKSGAVLPLCNPVSVEVKPKIFAWVSINCDTGIR